MNDSNLKIETATLHTYTFWDVAIYSQAGVRVEPRLTVISSVPLTVGEATPFPQDGEGSGLTDPHRVMLEAAGYSQYRELSGDVQRIFTPAWNGDERAMATWTPPFRVVSKNGEAPLYRVDRLPTVVAREMFKGVELHTEEVDGAELLNEAVAQAKALHEANVAHNFEDGNRIDEIVEESAQLRQLLARGDSAPETTGYAVVESTEFDNALVEMNGRESPMAKVRVTHTAPPEYVSFDDDDAHRKDGYIGYWKFSPASIGFRLREGNKPGEAVVGFNVTKAGDFLRVLVKDFAAITPLGRVGIPVEVYRQMTGGDPERILTEDEASNLNAGRAASHAETRDFASLPN